METMRHEACHVATHAGVEETAQDAHGVAFRGCMKRFDPLVVGFPTFLPVVSSEF